MSSTDNSELPEVLLHGPLLDGAPLGHRLGLLQALPRKSAPAGTTLFREGDSGDAMWILVSGSVSLTARAGEQRVELDRARAGDVFGELAIISPAARSARAVTLQDSTFLLLERRAFQRLLEARSPAGEALLRYLTRRICRRLRRSDARIALISDALSGADAAWLRGRARVLESL
jgi:CRP-like cAMP-binding protein